MRINAKPIVLGLLVIVDTAMSATVRPPVDAEQATTAQRPCSYDADGLTPSIYPADFVEAFLQERSASATGEAETDTDSAEETVKDTDFVPMAKASFLRERWLAWRDLHQLPTYPPCASTAYRRKP